VKSRPDCIPWWKMKHANMAQCDRKLYFRVVCLALVLSLVSGKRYVIGDVLVSLFCRL